MSHYVGNFPARNCRREIAVQCYLSDAQQALFQHGCTVFPCLHGEALLALRVAAETWASHDCTLRRRHRAI